MANPSWRDKLRPASFRGVAFETVARSMEGGRRVALHVYPNRDEAYPEDMGGKPKIFSVDGYVIGPDYLNRKAALGKALDTKGPGEYVDRWGETHQVQVQGYTVSENKGELGQAVFRISFVLWSPPVSHAARADTRSAAMQAASGAQASVRGSFAAAMAKAGGWLKTVRAVIGVARAVAAFARNFKSIMLGWLGAEFLALVGVSPMSALRIITELFSIFGLFGGSGASATRLTVAADVAAEILRGIDPPSERVSTFGGRPVEEYRRAEDFAGATAEMMGAVLAPLAPAGRYEAARALAVASAQEAATASAGATRAGAGRPNAPEVDAEVAVHELVRGLALVWQAAATADMPFQVYDDAVAVRQQVAEDLDAYMMTAPDPVYREMARLRAAVVADITARGADLTRLTEVTPAATVPALVLAQNLYGDATRADEVVARNRVRHPGFVLGGRTLKVPSDA